MRLSFLPRRLLVPTALLGLLLGAAACASNPLASDAAAPNSEAAASSTLTLDLRALATHAWLHFDQTRHTCETFDYFPAGGIYTFYCRARTFLSVEALLANTDLPVFESGPHQGTLVRDATDSFGHYNPAFVSRLADWALPAATHPALLPRTREVYTKAVRPLATTLWATYQRLQQHPEYLQAEATRLQLAMQSPQGVPRDHYERYFFMMNPHFFDAPEADFNYFYNRGFDGGVYEGNVVKSAVGFWIRRHIDGTDALFADQLKRLFEVYEPALVADQPHPTKQAWPTSPPLAHP
ncbi:hypothetical protein DV096_19870 [Bradymonadaceae bacterium TMQ3]|nr:hypothetical protein DV096_19870 [Bradymonadaceae bacterium TMQ3]TXC67895.1 hypothetical protein FRC91_19645 [Bradymonadales bacterium TMQ1]